VNYLDREIQTLKQELLALKTEKSKRINNLTVLEYTVPVTFRLEEYQASQYTTRIRSTQRIEITAKSQMDRGYFISARIDVTGLDSRTLIWGDDGYTDADGLQYKIYGLRVYDSTNASDVQKIEDGQTPVVDYNIVITSTTPLNITTEYF